MEKVRIFEGDFLVENAKFAIVAAKFNSFIVDHLLEGATGVLAQHNISDKAVDIVRVPGAFELPLITRKLAASKAYDAIIVLGAVIRGGTPHFEYVAGECAKGISAVAYEFEMPVAFGVLTVDTIEQAIERAGAKAGNKGAEAATTALEMTSLLRKLAQ
ncbi:MAG: 6,7-dimethyl-8-ribityllumazine synthase [Gammaproteobacteria bacterium]